MAIADSSGEPQTPTPSPSPTADGAPASRPAATNEDGTPRPAARRRRRGSRGGRGRGGAGRAQGAPNRERQPDDLPERASDGTAPPEVAAAAVVQRKPQIGDTRPAPAAEKAGEAGGTRRRRRRGGRGRGSGRVEGAAAPIDEEILERRRGRERKGRPVGRYLMLVSVRTGVTQIAVLEGRALIEHYVSRPQDDVSQIDGNVYQAKVQNVLPGMEAAFVDIGTPKNAVLYRGDVQYDREDLVEGGSAARIENLLRPGQSILCQVTKNPIGSKGARLTQEVSLPGRFVVLLPNSDTYGISKRLGDDERRRLRKVLDDVRSPGHGLIVRTAAEGATADELRRDVALLEKQWRQIEDKAKQSTAPTLLYREPDLAVRIIREEFNTEYRGVVIDDPTLYEQVRDYVESISPELADRVEFYDPAEDPLPIFERFHVHEQIHKAIDRKVWLPSGGSLIIERTEALTVIDVNTGKNVGSSSLEETVYRNNLEAAEEIARQLRLRDIGGIIVIDFIDMEIRRNRDDVVRSFRDALSRDKTRTQVFDISDLGLLEMTRKRVSEGLVESFSSTCPVCNGRGIVLDESLL
ncbi:MAG TPA: Rne/Rng family ribonuclease [Acidimicrobiales bacterium]|nr:Rne/Rng family ribonuclease [Acidimicrobiales bacterium]